MDLAIILTYRCNSRCSMCNAWQHPTPATAEVSLNTLARLPAGIDYLNLTGGEPTLRPDLEAIVDLLHPKAMQLEISSNGILASRLEPIIRRYPKVKVRFSLDGLSPTNEAIRGEPNGAERRLEGLARLRALGGQDLGLAMTIQDANAHETVQLFELAEAHHYDLATSTLHNAFQFHKQDNQLRNPPAVAAGIRDLMVAQLKSRRVKNWFRAYLNLGLVRKALGQPRLIPCRAATDFVFIDPWADVYACNVRPDLKLGNLAQQAWDEILHGPTAQAVRERVAQCALNCWMVGSAKPAMRHPRFRRLPRAAPLRWVVRNRARVLLGRPIRIEGLEGEA